MNDGLKRRDFLKVVGASGAGAGVLGCSTEKVENLMPYVTPPEEITPGVATWYSTVCGECEAGCGMWVRTQEGRVVKVEGNPNDPVSKGALCSKGHSSLQGLYNPDRFKGPMIREGGQLKPISWVEAEEVLAGHLERADNYYLITGSTGPSLTGLVDSFAGDTGGKILNYNPLDHGPLREASRIVFGRDVVPWYDLGSAKCIISFGADFLDGWLSPLRDSRGFSKMSAVGEGGFKGRFVFAAPRLSLTGQNADEWLPIAPGTEALVALAMANVISGGTAEAGPYQEIVDAHSPEDVAAKAGVSAESIRRAANHLVEDGPSLVLGPGIEGQHRNSTAVNVAVAILNFVAGNVGKTVDYSSPQFGASSRSSSYESMQDAIGDMRTGEVPLVLVHAANPAYALPSTSGFKEAFGQVSFKVSFASAMDETAAMADLILPDRHFLESWGDSSWRSGRFSIQQPAMQPVPHFDSKQVGDVLLSVAENMGVGSGNQSFYEWLRLQWQSKAATEGVSDFEHFWREGLRTGVIDTESESESSSSEALRETDRALVFDSPEFDGEGDLHLMVYPSARFGDGSMNANRPWLQELADPVSKIAWHSWVEMHPDRAESLGVQNGDVLTLSTDYGALEVPAWIYPGIRQDVIALAMGGGHTEAGRFANGNGVNPMDLIPAEVEALSGGLVHFITKVAVTPTDDRYQLASIAGSDVQSNRPITPVVSLEEWTRGTTEHSDEGGHGPLKELQGIGGFVPIETEGLPENFPLDGSKHGEYGKEDEPRWAMAIDLDKCTGCSACVTACQSENNVPWVGESQVAMGRDMGWIRMERYYEAVDATQAGPVDIRFLPMLCQHCNNAPCEPVCPVFATYHTPDGLNAQIYNRCVGTRYCANNCPYKVRVFNWYTFTDEEPVREGLGHIPEPLNWQLNPDVTVRENGVMEKCSFCVHRIRNAQNRAALEDGVLAETDVVTACQQTCAAEAIVFGNIKDPNSKISRISKDQRSYRVLNEITNTQPAVSYLKKVTFHDVVSEGH